MEVASLRRRQWTLLSLKPAKLDAACAEAKTAARHSSQAFHGASSERESLPADLHFAVELQVQNLESCVTRIGTHPCPLAYLEVLTCSMLGCTAHVAVCGALGGDRSYAQIYIYSQFL